MKDAKIIKSPADTIRFYFNHNFYVWYCYETIWFDGNMIIKIKFKLPSKIIIWDAYTITAAKDPLVSWKPRFISQIIILLYSNWKSPSISWRVPFIRPSVLCFFQSRCFNLCNSSLLSYIDITPLWFSIIILLYEFTFAV